MTDQSEQETPWEVEVVHRVRRYRSDYRENSNDYKPPKAREIAHESAEIFDDLGVVATTRETETIWVYHTETGLWVDDGEQYLRTLIDRGTEDLFTPTLFRKVIEKVKARTLIDRDELGAPEGSIAVENGLLDLHTEDIRPLTPDNRATWQLPVLYDSDAECPRTLDFLEEVFPTDTLPLIQEYLGYSLTESTRRDKALMVLGPTNSGKSVFLDVLRAFFGKENTASVAPHEYTNSRWGKAGLEGKQVNIRHDLNTKELENLGILKEIISGDPIRAERKGQPVFEFQPRAKHFYAANNAPRPSRDEEAFWNRWLTIITPRSIPEEEQDPKLTEKLTTAEELSGLLNWALAGYDRLQSQEQFTNAPTPEENKRRWQRFGGSVDRFIYEELQVTKKSGDFEYGDDLFGEYERFAESEDLPSVSRQKFTKHLIKRDGVGKTKRDRDGTRIRSYTGIIHHGGE